MKKISSREIIKKSARETQRIKLIGFSQTGITRKILEGINLGVGGDGVKQVDLTLLEKAINRPQWSLMNWRFSGFPSAEAVRQHYLNAYL